MAATVTPYLVIAGAAEAIAFYTRAFGATETMRLAEPSGRIGHAEITIGDALVMIADEYPELSIRGPKALGGSPVTLHLRVDDVDAVAARAVAAGAKVLIPVQNQFYGERSGRFEDPFGHVWVLSTHVEDVSPEEMQRRYEDYVKTQGG
jgi:PhnB protein